MKKVVLSLCSVFCILCCSILFFGCNENNKNIINIKGIEIMVSNAESKNQYPIEYLSINVLDLQTNEITQIYEETNPDYIITLPKSPMSEAFFNANQNSILKINGDKFRLIVNLTIKYNNESIYLNANENIVIIKTKDNFSIKNEKYKDTIIGDLINFNFTLNNGQTENLSLHFNYEEIKN